MPASTTTRAAKNGTVPTRAAAAAAAAATAAQPPQLVIGRLATETLVVPIIGTAGLIVHQWSEKAKLQMLNTQQGAKKIREPRKPEEEYQASLYRAGDGAYGFPAMGFKNSAVSAARLYDKSVKMTELRQLLFFKGTRYPTCNQTLFVIEGEPQMREDMVTVGVSGTDLRYRAEFTEWRTTLIVRYIKSTITRESVLDIINAGGMTVGVGEWRPEKNGEAGTYEIDQDRDLNVIG